VKILRKLDEWQRAGLIDDGHVAGITRYEEEHAPGTQWVVWGTGAVGALAIVTGIVSVISANWDEFPVWLKLTTVMALLLGSLAGARRTARFASTWPRDIFLLLHGGLTLATVGLVAQVYHLHGHAWRAPALCAVLALPAAIIATRSLLTYVPLVYVTIGSLLLLDDFRWLESDGMVLRFGAAAFGLLLILGARLLAERREGTASALRTCGFAGLACVAAHACASWSQSSRSDAVHEPGSAVVAAVGIFAVSVALHVGLELVTPATGRSKRLGALGIFVVLLVGGAVASASLDHVATTEYLGRQLLGFALCSALCITMAISAAHAGDRRGTNLATLALALRILVLYLELARDLMTTGIGLIGSGVVFLGLAYGWWRLRRVLPVVAEIEGGAP